MKRKKSCLIGLLLGIYFSLSISVSALSFLPNLDRDFHRLLVFDTPGIVYNDLRGFELEVEKIGFAGQKLEGAYFESIRLENKDSQNVVLNQFTEDDHFSLYKSENTQQRSVAKTAAGGRLSFDSMYRVQGDYPYDFALDDLEPPSIYQSKDKTVLTEQDADAEGYLAGINQGAPVDLEVGFYLLHEIWPPIGDFSPALTNENLYRRYSRTDTVWIVHLYLDNDGNPRAEYRSGKFKEKTSGEEHYYVLEDVAGLFPLSLDINERIKVMLGGLENTLHPEFHFKITKKNRSGETISSSSAKFGLSKINETGEAKDLRKVLAYVQREGDSKLPTNYFQADSLNAEALTHDGIVNFGNLNKNNLYIMYELAAPDGYIRAEETAYFVYFDKSDNYAFENLDGIPIVFEGKIMRDSADGHATSFKFTKLVSSQFDLKAVRFTLNKSENELREKIDDFVVYVPKYCKILNDSIEEWKQLDLSAYVRNLQAMPEFSNFEFTANDGLGTVDINTHGYMVTDVEEKLKKLLRKDNNYLTMPSSSNPPELGDWIDIQYNWIEKVLDDGEKEYWIDPNSYEIHVNFVNNNPPPNGFLPMTGKIFTKPIVWVILGIFVAIIAIVIYKKTYRNNEEL